MYLKVTTFEWGEKEMELINESEASRHFYQFVVCYYFINGLNQMHWFGLEFHARTQSFNRCVCAGVCACTTFQAGCCWGWRDLNTCMYMVCLQTLMHFCERSLFNQLQTTSFTFNLLNGFPSNQNKANVKLQLRFLSIYSRTPKLSSKEFSSHLKKLFNKVKYIVNQINNHLTIQCSLFIKIFFLKKDILVQGFRVTWGLL